VAAFDVHAVDTTERKVVNEYEPEGKVRLLLDGAFGPVYGLNTIVSMRSQTR
jgi:hypothetical protein